MKYLYIPKEFAVETKFKHKYFEGVMIYSLPLLTFFFAYEISSIFQKKVSFLKLSTTKYTSP